MRVLVVRFSSIGDIVLTTPVVRALHRQLGAEVHVVVKKAFAPIWEANPYVRRVHAMERHIGELIPDLRRQRFDYVADLHKNLRSLHLRLALRRPGRAFPKLNFRKWLLTTFKWNVLPDVHIVHRYFEAVRPLGAHYDGEGLDWFFPEGQVQDAAAFGLEPGRYVAFAIGAAHATKRLPFGKMEAICRLLQRPVALLGGPAEADTGERLARTAGPHVHNLCGKTTLHGSARVLEQAGAVLTHDTGMMHIAAALRKSIVSVWGNTVPAFGMYPFYPDGAGIPSRIFEVRDLSCRPCSKIGYDRCPKGHFHCMERLDAAEIAAAVETLMPR
ncbi:MAG: lipopolysaccharide heptosyltransferase family protein [Bacteroidetes bacterium]|nr:MAG: lipopolysaccharide heptosyltransferase family protein [Bacteroidota bacterium]